MKKMSIILILSLLLCGVISAENNKPRVVILNFKTINLENKEISLAVTENLITSIIDNGQYTVVERAQFDAIMDELKLSNSDALTFCIKMNGADIISTAFNYEHTDKYGIHQELVVPEDKWIRVVIPFERFTGSDAVGGMPTDYNILKFSIFKPFFTGIGQDGLINFQVLLDDVRLLTKSELKKLK